MFKTISGLSVLSIALIATAFPAPALARAHGHVVRAQGPNGGSAVQWRGVQRQPGETTVRSGLQTSNGRGYRASRDTNYEPGHIDSTRSMQTNGGRGSTTEREANWGDGHYTGSKKTTLNNGKSFSRETTATANGNGSADYSTTFTGPEGNSKTVTGTATRR
jgi:hypothetical protein